MGCLDSSVSGTNILPKFSPDVFFAEIHFLISVVHLFILVRCFPFCRENVFCYGHCNKSFSFKDSLVLVTSSTVAS